MNAETEEVLSSANRLSSADRVELVEAMIAQLDAENDDLPFDESWLPEIERRSAEFDAGGVETFTWEQVKASARQGG
jgi:putative addiction module component (TIGR02574 family)